jgi:hypothetical protein
MSPPCRILQRHGGYTIGSSLDRRAIKPCRLKTHIQSRPYWNTPSNEAVPNFSILRLFFLEMGLSVRRSLVPVLSFSAWTTTIAFPP